MHSSIEINFTEAEIDELLQSFASAWESGRAPSIDLRYRQLCEITDERESSPLFREVVLELIAIDLKNRWKSTNHQVPNDVLPQRPCLEDYLKLYPELGGLADLPLHLAAEEYRARRNAGEQPLIEMYLKRFGEGKTELEHLLAQVEAEVLLERAKIDEDTEAAEAPGMGTYVPSASPPEAAETPAPVKPTSTVVDGPEMIVIMDGVAPEAWSHKITSKPLKIGRTDEADIRFLHPLISRHHCTIWQGPDGPYVRDERSRNGTYVNNERIEETKLEDGDRIVVGAFSLRVVKPRSVQRYVTQETEFPPSADPASFIQRMPEGDERRLAAEVHRRLTPSRRLTLPGLFVQVGYRPSGQLGGDFFECVDMGNGRWMLAMFDAMSHGTSAALAIMLLRSELGRWISLTHSPSQCLEWINKELIQIGISELYINGCLSVWHPRQRFMVIAAAGQRHPLVVRDGMMMSEIRTDVYGMPLGVSLEEEYPEQLVDLRRGDQFYLFTDGVVGGDATKKGHTGADKALFQQLARFDNRSMESQIEGLLKSRTDQTDDAILVGCEVVRDDAIEGKRKRVKH